MYQRILVPVDGSNVSANGLREAMRLARDQNAKLRLIHIVNELMVVAAYDGAIYSTDFIDALREAGKKILDNAAEKVKAAGIQVETALLEAYGGHAGDVIVKDARESASGYHCAWHAWTSWYGAIGDG